MGSGTGTEPRQVFPAEAAIRNVSATWRKIGFAPCSASEPYNHRREARSFFQLRLALSLRSLPALERSDFVRINCEKVGAIEQRSRFGERIVAPACDEKAARIAKDANPSRRVVRIHVAG